MCRKANLLTRVVVKESAAFIIRSYIRSLEEGTATHSNIVAWRIPWTEEPGWLQSIGSHRVRHNWSNLACTHTYKKSWAASAQMTWTPCGFQRSIFKGQVREGRPRLCDQLVHTSWLMVWYQGCATGVNIINSQAPASLGVRTHGHQAVKFVRLVGALISVKQLRNGR